jgi:hypothetical protein
VILEYFRKMVASLETFSTALSPDLLSPSPSTSAMKTPDPSASLVKTEQPPPHKTPPKKRKKGNLMPRNRWMHPNGILL